MDWCDIDPEPLFDAIREHGPAPDAEQAVWAFEQALGVARIDGALVEHLLVACVCLRAFEEDVAAHDPRADLPARRERCGVARALRAAARLTGSGAWRRLSRPGAGTHRQ